jgi:hypothetical protein
MRFLIIIFLLSFSLVLQAQDANTCSDVSIDTSKMPKNNDLNFQEAWCLFWTSTDLLSFYEDEPLSSYDLALQYFNDERIRSNQFLPESVVDTGGNITAALIVGQSSKGLCLESQTNFTNSDWAQLSVMFKKLTDPKKDLITIMCENHLQNSLPFSQISPDILKIINQLSADKKAAALLDLTCGQRHTFKNKYGVGNRTIETFSDAKVMEKLDEMLSDHKPVSASYDYEFVKSGLGHTRSLGANDVAHASTIIGRRMNPVTANCEYLIKDSVGNRCPKKTIYECNKANGQMWVPRENLQKNIYEVNWLIKKN